VEGASGGDKDGARLKETSASAILSRAATPFAHASRALSAAAMRMLLSNDDGIDAPGLAALEEALRALGEVVVVAPATEQSAKSHSLTMHRPLRVSRRGPGRYAVTGTPADAVYLALHHLVPGYVDLVVSGINRGGNLGGDVHYSGTVAAAREACMQGVPAMAVSARSVDGVVHFDTAAQVAVDAARRLLDHPLPRGVFLNVNVPCVPPSELRGARVVPLGERTYAHAVDERVDPRGGVYYWIGGPHLAFEGGDDTDGAAVEAGFASLTPLGADPTNLAALEALRGW